MLVTPRNLLIDEKEPFFKGAVSPFSSVLNKRPVIVKQNLSNNSQFKRRDKFGLTRHKYIPHYTECKNCHQQESKNYTTFCPHAFRAKGDIMCHVYPVEDCVKGLKGNLFKLAYS